VLRVYDLPGLQPKARMENSKVRERALAAAAAGLTSALLATHADPQGCFFLEVNRSKARYGGASAQSQAVSLPLHTRWLWNPPDYEAPHRPRS
jgi:hypothetical protein